MKYNHNTFWFDCYGMLSIDCSIRTCNHNLTETLGLRFDRLWRVPSLHSFGNEKVETVARPAALLLLCRLLLLGRCLEIRLRVILFCPPCSIAAKCQY